MLRHCDIMIMLRIYFMNIGGKYNDKNYVHTINQLSLPTYFEALPPYARRLNVFHVSVGVRTDQIYLYSLVFPSRPWGNSTNAFLQVNVGK